MTHPKRVQLLVGSPRGKRSTSTAVGSYVLNLLKQKGLEPLASLWIGHILKSPEKIDEFLKAVEAADMIILAAPLYDDCQPYIVIKAMELLAAHQREQSTTQKRHDGKLFSVIVNCAFPEEHHPETVLRIYRRFAKDMGFLWGGSLAIRAGEALQGRQGKTLDDIGSMAKKVKEALVRMADSLSKGSPSADETLSVIPESFSHGPLSFLGSFFIWLNNRGWAKQAKKRGEDVNARPYME
ncbi:MAG: hypothetical protein GTO17_04310 [Candidatus Aminicenantes bacterium]|nr:hypothetical protein [Candidatus Aminicenantes bacterium]